MPVYQFQCEKCDHMYEELTEYDEKGKYKGVKCPECKSKKKTKLISSMFIQGTSARDNIFSNKAGKNMARAKNERRAAEAASHVGSTPYNKINDLGNDSAYI